jgi:hypothetical protein
MHKPRTLLGVGCCLLLLLGAVSFVEAGNLRRHRKLLRSADRDLVVQNQYIVVFTEDVDVDDKMASLLQGINKEDCQLMYAFKEDMRGVALNNVPDALLWQILDDDDVLFIEEGATNAKKSLHCCHKYDFFAYSACRIRLTLMQRQQQKRSIHPHFFHTERSSMGT